MGGGVGFEYGRGGGGCQAGGEVGYGKIVIFAQTTELRGGGPHATPRPREGGGPPALPCPTPVLPCPPLPCPSGCPTLPYSLWLRRLVQLLHARLLFGM